MQDRQVIREKLYRHSERRRIINTGIWKGKCIYDLSEWLFKALVQSIKSADKYKIWKDEDFERWERLRVARKERFFDESVCDKDPIFEEFKPYGECVICGRTYFRPPEVLGPLCIGCWEEHKIDGIGVKDD